MSRTKPQAAEPSTMMRYCSFCGKSNDEVGCLVAGTNAFICDDCTFACSEIVEGLRIRLIVEREVDAALAQRIEAQSATTEGRGPEDESPVAESDAPKPYRD